MRKLALLLAVVALAAMPSGADAAKKSKKRAAAPAATMQETPGAPAARLAGGFFRDVSKVGQPPAPAAKGKKK